MQGALDYLVAARHCEVRDLESLQRTCELVLVVNDLVHYLQQERGASNMFLGAGGKKFGPLRQQRVQDSIAAEAAFRRWLENAGQIDSLSGGARLYTRIAGALHALQGLAEMRGAIETQQCSATDVLRQFGQLIDVLLALVFEAADVAVDPSISRFLIALFHLMQGKEYAGQERATGAVAFAAGYISAESKRSIEYLIDMQEHALSSFETFGDDIRLEWKALQSMLPMAELEQMRRRLLSSADGKLDAGLAVAWFECCSRRIDELHRVETALAHRLRQLAAERVAALRTQIADDTRRFDLAVEDVALAPQAVFRSNVTQMPASRPASGLGNTGPHLMQAVVNMLQTQTQRLQNVTEELATVRAALDERKWVERAKGLLMAHHGLDEEAAYRLLRQNAMNQKRRLSEVARAVISLAEMLPASKSAGEP
jgi:hypothetical protein